MQHLQLQTACRMAIQHFQRMLEGCCVCIFTDHKTLTRALHSMPDRQTLSAIWISSPSTRRTSATLLALRMSLQMYCPILVLLPYSNKIDFTQIASDHVWDDEIVCLQQSTVSIILKSFSHNSTTGGTILCNVSTSNACSSVIPGGHRCSVYSAIHGLSHLSGCQSHGETHHIMCG